MLIYGYKITQCIKVKSSKCLSGHYFREVFHESYLMVIILLTMKNSFIKIPFECELVQR